MFVCLCVCIQCRVEGVQNILCMWGILKVLKCISCPLIVVVEEGCVCVCVCVCACFEWHFLPNCFILASTSVAIRDAEILVQQSSARPLLINIYHQLLQRSAHVFPPLTGQDTLVSFIIVQ